MDQHIDLTVEEIEKCRDFAEKSAKTQREYRSGGTQMRGYSLIFNDTFRGKIGEMISKNFLKNEFDVDTKIDFDIYPRGQWDSTDIEINDIKISIKSAKWFSSWLLLESRDIERGGTYPFYILVLVDKNNNGGIIAGYATNKEISQGDPNTLILKKGEFIPNTNTPLDANNHARHKSHLHNSLKGWEKLIETIR